MTAEFEGYERSRDEARTLVDRLNDFRADLDETRRREPTARPMRYRLRLRWQIEDSERLLEFVERHAEGYVLDAVLARAALPKSDRPTLEPWCCRAIYFTGISQSNSR